MARELALVPYGTDLGKKKPFIFFRPTKKEKLELIGNIRNQALYGYTFIKDIYRIIQNYIFGNGKDKKSKKLFEELEELVLAEPDKTAENILWLYEEKIVAYLLHVNEYEENIYQMMCIEYTILRIADRSVVCGYSI
jgi:hypothetical protein